ncbi:MAG: NAD-dependent epimerase/dehydratase family protein [Deltaproteobacteria bacterium]|nr:NAD-dependent epimerase/dehydratase family protein [Deltaproteobacteria bacterium]
MLALVTGATGFLGSRLARRLAGSGVAVRTMIRRTSSSRRIADLAVEQVPGDVTDRSSVRRAMTGADVVYHSAALYELGARDPELMERTNVQGTANVLEIAAELGVPAVHVSSVAALGPTGSDPVGEGHWRGDAPRSAYEATKRRAHVVARSLIASGASIRIGLPVTIYGPDDPSLVGRFHASFAKGWIRIGALGEMLMSLVHVDDCAEGLVRIAREGAIGSEYILSGQVVTTREWIEALARAAGRKPPRIYLPTRILSAIGRPVARLAGDRAPLLREALEMSAGLSWAFSGDRARRELGWQPRPLEDGLREVLEWYLQAGLRS